MDYIIHIAREKSIDPTAIEKVLDGSLSEKDVLCRKSRRLLNEMGLENDEALMLLALHKSSVKYGYDLSLTSLSRLFKVAREHQAEAPLLSLFESPFFLVKACWLYEHVPYFLYFGEDKQEELDEFIIRFAKQYDTLFLKHRLPIETWGRVENPRRILAVTFWENQVFDPVSMVDKVRHENLEGLELSMDFHPFNYTKLLPEELTAEKREEIKEACRKSGIKIDIHSPIVGPYSPYPDPKRGKQLFFNPLNCFELQCETIELAKDIAAGSVVIHLVDNSDLGKMTELVKRAEGSRVRVTIENYCQTKKMQNSDFFLACIDEISRTLPDGVRKRNFGITLDVGHFNIEGEDPLIASEKIGYWCQSNGIFLRMHATDNYGKLLFSPPAYSADVHGNVTGRGVNNRAIILLLRSLGHSFDVLAEQLQPLSPQDIDVIHGAQTAVIDESYDALVLKGREFLSSLGTEALISPEVKEEKAYQLLAGIDGVFALREHLIYRKIQEKRYLSVDEVKKISQEFMKMPEKFKKDILEYVDDLLLPIQRESGAIQKSEIDLICQNISGALFGTINNEHLNQIFSEAQTYNQGDVICEQDTSGQEMFLIKGGEMTVVVNGSPLAVLGPGEIFGEISLFYNVKRTATIKASKDKTTVGILTREGFETLLKSHQPYCYDLIYRLYSILPERMRNLNDKYKTAINALNIVQNGHKKKMKFFENINEESKPKTDIFISITQEEALVVFKEMKILGKDQLVFTEGDKGDGAYFILEGRVKAVTFSSDYEEIMLGEMGSGEIFGEMALIDDKPRSATILTVTPCKLAFISSKDFNEFIETRSELAFRFMSFICLSLFWRILRLDKVYADIKEAFK